MVWIHVCIYARSQWMHVHATGCISNQQLHTKISSLLDISIHSRIKLNLFMHIQEFSDVGAFVVKRFFLSDSLQNQQFQQNTRFNHHTWEKPLTLTLEKLSTSQVNFLHLSVQWNDVGNIIAINIKAQTRSVIYELTKHKNPHALNVYKWRVILQLHQQVSRWTSSIGRTSILMVIIVLRW